MKTGREISAVWVALPPACPASTTIVCPRTDANSGSPGAASSVDDVLGASVVGLVDPDDSCRRVVEVRGRASDVELHAASTASASTKTVARPPLAPNRRHPTGERVVR